MARPAKLKCQLCTMMPATQAKRVHGEIGDGCWDARLCAGRRAFYRRRAKELLQASESLPVIPVTVPKATFALLFLYRASESSPLHALGAELWDGQKAIARIETIHCFGYTASQVVAFSQEVLKAFSAQYDLDLRQFKDQIRLKPEACPIRPCPLHPEISY
jgi:hypothetical protein